MEKKRILVVDDEEEITSMIKSHLERKNEYEVRTLSEAKNILPHVHVFKPDVILLDLLIPGTGGLEICELLNNDPIGMGTPIIVLSGLGGDVDRVRAYKLGVVDYLVKPVVWDELTASIEKAIKYKSQQG